MMGQNGKQKAFLDTPFSQRSEMQVRADLFRRMAAKNRRTLPHMPMSFATPRAVRPALGLKTGMQLAGVMQKNQNGKARDLGVRQRSARRSFHPGAHHRQSRHGLETSRDIGAMMRQMMAFLVAGFPPWGAIPHIDRHNSV